jgi:hypothetical protein
MNPAIVVVIVLVISALLILACKKKAFDDWFNFAPFTAAPDFTSSYSYQTPVVVSPPVPAAYPMYDVNYRYPYGVPWDVDVERRRRWRR